MDLNRFLEQEGADFSIWGTVSGPGLFFLGKGLVKNRHKGVFFLLCRSGSGTWLLNGQTYACSSGCMLCVRPGHLFRLLQASEDFSLSVLFFGFDFLVGIPFVLGLEVSEEMERLPFLALEPAGASCLSAYMDFMDTRYRQGSGTLVMKGLVFSFILEVNRLYAGKSEEPFVSRSKELVEGFLGLLLRYYKKEKKVAFYAFRLHVSEKHLLRCIRETTGQTFHEWLSIFILKEAKLLLRSTTWDIEEIADNLGFVTASAFSRFFKHGMDGLTPSAYRRGVGTNPSGSRDLLI